MVKQMIQIFTRVKPPVWKHQSGIYSIDDDENLTPSLEIIIPRDLTYGFVNNKRENYRFKKKKKLTSVITICLLVRLSPLESMKI
uniref:Uncharacterized protein n=1 Tax=Sciurus vulgaris TaxID=55149 RepID=A0A8D2DNK3_SCIVU